MPLLDDEFIYLFKSAFMMHDAWCMMSCANPTAPPHSRGQWAIRDIPYVTMKTPYFAVPDAAHDGESNENFRKPQDAGTAEPLSLFEFPSKRGLMCIPSVS
jgi:hypothetical protein